ncbi:hypothetical protein [Citrobacter freundii]
MRLYSGIGQALLEAKESGSDPYAAIEAVIPWDEFTESVSEAELLARPEGFDHLHLVGENFATLRRYTPALLEVLELRAAPAAQGVLAAVQTLREMNADNLRKVPADAPTAFIKPRWKPLVITPEGLDRKFYEICALSELKNALRSGDIWVKGSRQFRDFDDYLLPAEKFAALKREQALPRRSTRTATSTGRAFAAAGRAVGHRHPPGQGQRAARCHPHRVRAENHPAGCGGAGSGAGADRPNQPVTAAHQDHRTADGRGRLDGLQPPLHPLEGRGRGQRQDVAAVRNPR